MSAPHAASPDAKLVTMANQIATFFASQPREDAVAGIENHIRKFWDPRMRGKIRDLAATGDDRLAPLAREAIGRLAD
jgi:formate dehydrogenase subunit delta